jgi:hypothetical protein
LARSERCSVKEQEILRKEAQILSLLCKHPANYEELAETVNFGWADTTLNDAIDDLVQKRLQVVSVPEPIRYAGPPARELHVHMYKVTSK